MIKLQEFAKERGVTDRQIQRLLKKYEEDLQGHFERRGQNGTWLDDIACDYLQKKMRTTPSGLKSHSDDELVEFLKKELEEKNLQIHELQKLLNQEQQLHLMAEQKLLEKSKKTEKKWWQKWKTN